MIEVEDRSSLLPQPAAADPTTNMAAATVTADVQAEQLLQQHQLHQQQLVREHLETFDEFKAGFEKSGPPSPFSAATAATEETNNDDDDDDDDDDCTVHHCNNSYSDSYNTNTSSRTTTTSTDNNKSGTASYYSYTDNHHDNESCAALSKCGAASIRYRCEQLDRLTPLKSTHFKPSFTKSKSVSLSLGPGCSRHSTKSPFTFTASSLASSPSRRTSRAAIAIAIVTPPPPSPSINASTTFTSTLGNNSNNGQPGRRRFDNFELHAHRASLNCSLEDIGDCERSQFSNASSYYYDHQPRKRVQFTFVEILEIPTILDCAPVTLGGPSITMGWAVERRSFHNISDMEHIKEYHGQCSWQQTFYRALTATERTELMYYECGYSLQEIDEASQISEFFHQQRLETTLLDLVDKMEEGQGLPPPQAGLFHPGKSMENDSRSPEELHQEYANMNAYGTYQHYADDDADDGLKYPALRRPEADDHDDDDRIFSARRGGPRPQEPARADHYLDHGHHHQEKEATFSQHHQYRHQPTVLEQLQQQQLQQRQLVDFAFQHELERQFEQMEDEQSYRQ